MIKVDKMLISIYILESINYLSITQKNLTFNSNPITKILMASMLHKITLTNQPNYNKVYQIILLNFNPYLLNHLMLLLNYLKILLYSLLNNYIILFLFSIL